jgi:1-deoxy-D-xylulose-5-phosphate reductoisomerase
VTAIDTAANDRPPKRVILLGATGSIGTSTLKVARDLREKVRIVGLAANRNSERLAQAAAEFGVRDIAIGDESQAARLRTAVPAGTRVRAGQTGLIDLVGEVEADLVLVAIVGTGGLRPALAAIERGCDLAVASKEILVVAGEAVMAAARARGVRILPVDSEHNAIFQCLEGRDSATVSRLLLTASGGPFRTWPAEELEAVTVAQALNHPTWEMGPKITIDSATLFNKGLEMIEARWLFDIAIDRIDVIVHPQSIVHSMVEFIDGSILAQMSESDMCFPIQYAITWPQRTRSSLRPLDFSALGQLTFEKPRRDIFPALDLARHAGQAGGTMPAVMNAANEVAVAAFLEGSIPFPRIWQAVGQVMEKHDVIRRPGLDLLLEMDAWARQQACAVLGTRAAG